MNKTIHIEEGKTFEILFRVTQIGVVSYGNECPSHGVYARVTEVKNWIQYITKEASLDSNCKSEIPYQPGRFCLMCTLYT